MDLAQLPFNQLIGLESSADTEALVRLPAGKQYTNHLGTVHASALLALAEAGSGAYLLQQLGDSAGFVPVVRKLEAKFKKPAHGAVSARCSADAAEITRWNEDLANRGRISACVAVEVLDESGTLALSAIVEWFIAKAN